MHSFSLLFLTYKAVLLRHCGRPGHFQRKQVTFLSKHLIVVIGTFYRVVSFLLMLLPSFAIRTSLPPLPA